MMKDAESMISDLMQKRPWVNVDLIREKRNWNVKGGYADNQKISRISISPCQRSAILGGSK